MIFDDRPCFTPGWFTWLAWLQAPPRRKEPEREAEEESDEVGK
jgi:hypothetical protein